MNTPEKRIHITLGPKEIKFRRRQAALTRASLARFEQATRQAARLRENAMLYQDAPSLYWPLRRDVDSKLWPYAVACLEAALSLSDIVIASYSKIVEAWELPGCQNIKNTSLKHWPDTRTWLDTMTKAYANNGTLPELPGVTETYAKYKHDADFNTLNLLVAEFVLLAFNHHQDIVEEAYKVTPGAKSIHIIEAIVTRSIIDHAGYEAAKLHRYQHPDIDHIMTAKPWPSTRKEREIRQQNTNTYKNEGFSLKADDTLLGLGEMFYRARVLYATLREAADYYSLDPLDLSKRIRPCDDAAGYPYQK